MAALSACGGTSPFEDVVADPTTPPAIPGNLAGDLQGITYDPAAQTLTVRGVSLDETPFEATYRRRPALDRAGYEAYTAQDSSLDRHSTAYVREVDGTRAGIVVTGGQFTYYFGGGNYSRDGAFTPPATTPSGGLVSYAGNYVGLLNSAGDGGDLLPVAAGTPVDVLPVQAAEVTGSILINADFADNRVNGVVYDRIVVDSATVLANIELAPTDIDATGAFSGSASQSLINKGSYGGIFGGTDAAVVAGTLFVEDHIDGFDNEEEYGLFVLDQCGTANADPLCNQPAR
jgi:hypothetical protein